MNIKSMAPRLWGRRPGKTLAFLAIALFMGLAWTTTSHAAPTAANTTIVNTVTVYFADAAGNNPDSLTSTASFVVTLVPIAPVLNAPDDQTIDASATATYSYTITSRANGLDTYVLNQVSITDSPGIGVSTASINGGVLTVDLGATVVAADVPIAASGLTSITVPSDGTGGGAVNGIDGDSFVEINGQVFDVDSVTDNGTGTSIITVTGNGTLTVVNVGDLIAEQVAFDVVVTPGTVTIADPNPFIDLVISANVDGDPLLIDTDETRTSVEGFVLTVTKYVRNADTPSVGNDLFNLYGVEYYRSGVEGEPGDHMEYLIRIECSGSSTATELIIEDNIPQFTTYVPGSIALALNPAALTDFVTLTDGLDHDAGAVDDIITTNTVFIYAGIGGDDDPGLGGSLAGGSTAYGRFQVTID